MTVRRQWLLILILIGVFSVSVNAFVLSSLTDKYFRDYMNDNYEKHFSQIVDYAQKALLDESYSAQQMAMELETHLIEPITRIKLYNAKGQLVVSVGNNSYPMRHMMGGNGMGRMMNQINEETDHIKIYDQQGQLLGYLNILRYGSARNSVATYLFKSALISNSLISIGIVLLVTVLIGILISKKMSSDLIKTAQLAQNIEMGNQTDFKFSNVKEIRTIQQSLEALKAKLMLKQKSRKKLIDELMHQSRTPLTILKTHLEGFEDGLITMTPEKMEICENQIENLSSIISNMSGMIDAEKDDEAIKIEAFDLNQLLKQIARGLKVQFDKKSIELRMLNNEKVMLKTDKYKLSQAIYNILTNAYKFTDSGGETRISYEVAKNKVWVSIEDNGMGMSKEDQQHIFDAYYRGSEANRISGEGIGLYVANENIKRIGGVIHIESQKGEGSKFIIKIPIEYKEQYAATL